MRPLGSVLERRGQVLKGGGVVLLLVLIFDVNYTNYARGGPTTRRKRLMGGRELSRRFNDLSHYWNVELCI